MKTILVFGLPGSGKTVFATKLKELFGDNAIHFNGDELRKTYNDWDFSEEGRRRQAERMRNAALNAHAEGKHAILDFVCPKEEYRELIDADIEVYMNIPPVRDFPDTTAIFENPEDTRGIFPGHAWEHRVDTYEESDTVCKYVFDRIRKYDFVHNAPTALMIGRFQPFHSGHKALFLKALEKHGQVCIAIRDMPTSKNNPYNAIEVAEMIEEELNDYLGKFTINILPNIVDVVYGRDVGWTVSKIDLPPEIEAISATQIRKDLGL
jgi:cytidyltransferase-like protein